MENVNRVLKAAEKLYCTQKLKSSRLDKEKVKQELDSKILTEDLFMCLEQEGELLWRYAEEAVPFTKDEWMEQVEKIWKYKKTFPVLYHVKKVYDKREAAVCVLMTAKMNMGEADRYLEACSLENPSYDTRPLYQLHYKEGFFRLYFTWCDKHGAEASFRECIRLYEEYEKELYYFLLERLHAAELRESAMKEESITKDIAYYSELCKNLGASMKLWELPLSLERQDEMQRMIVLLSHFERALAEKRDIFSYEDVLAANCRTRKRNERGTKLCSSLIEHLSQKSRMEDAMHEFIKQGIAPMGEACWRAISFIMREYGKSGGSGYETTELFGKRIYSGRNKKVKCTKEFSLFVSDSNRVEEILSFALNTGTVKDLIRFETSNTTLISELWTPRGQRGENVFSELDSSASQTSLSLFLREYLLWCEGKTSCVEFGRTRRHLPFSRWNREKMIHFALACGTKTEIGMASYLELLGYGEFRPVSEREYVVETALQICQMSKKLPILSILEMQSYFPYFAAKDALIEMERCFNEKAAAKWYRFSERFRWYDIFLPGANEKDKFQITKVQFGLYMVLAETLKYGQCYGFTSEETSQMEQELLLWISGQNNGVCNKEQQDIEMMGQFTFSEYMQDIESFGDFYADELADIILGERQNKRNGLGDNGKQSLKRIENVLEWTLQNASIVPFVKYRNAAYLRRLFDQWFVVLGTVNRMVGKDMEEELAKKYSASMKFVEKQCIGWVFWGGTENFSLNYYEKNFHMNHFADDKPVNNQIVGSRWFKSIQKLESDLVMWNTLCENVQLIKKCYLCTAKTEETQRANQKFLDKVEECRNVIKDILEYLENGMTAAEGLQYRYQKILENL